MTDLDYPAMPVALTYPGVHVEVVLGSVRSIGGVITAVTALVIHALRGPVDGEVAGPVRIFGYAVHERLFGSLWADSPISHPMYHWRAPLADIHLAALAHMPLDGGLIRGIALNAAADGTAARPPAAGADSQAPALRLRQPKATVASTAKPVGVVHGLVGSAGRSLAARLFGRASENGALGKKRWA